MDIIIQFNFNEYLNYYDYTKLLLTCREFYYNKYYNSDIIYKKYLENKFSKEFVIKAKPIIISYYDCFLRIINFEKYIISLNGELWDEKIYYAFWKI